MIPFSPLTYLKRIFVLYKKFFVKSWLNRFVKKHKGWLVVIPIVSLTVQLWLMTGNRDKWRDRHEIVMSENSFLKASLSARSYIMDDFDWPWYEKTKKGDSVRISGMNQAYEDLYGLDKIESLGKTNYQLVLLVIHHVFVERQEVTVLM